MGGISFRCVFCFDVRFKSSGGDGEIGGATGTSSVGYSFAVCNSPVLGGVFSEAFTYARANDRQQSVRKDGGRSEMDLLDIR